MKLGVMAKAKVRARLALGVVGYNTSQHSVRHHEKHHHRKSGTKQEWKFSHPGDFFALVQSTKQNEHKCTTNY